MITRGSVIIKNESGSTYNVVELGGLELANGAQLDLMDSGLASYYDDYEAANTLVTTLATAKLRQDILTEDIVVIFNSPPVE